MSDLANKCHAASKQLDSLNEESSGVRSTINENLVDAHSQLNGILLDVEVQEKALSDITSRINEESKEEVDMKQRKDTLSNEVRGLGERKLCLVIQTLTPFSPFVSYHISTSRYHHSRRM